MFTALDAPPEGLDPHEARFVASIREHGWFRTNVPAQGDEPGFSFTTGFWSSVQAPELIVFSLKSHTAHDVLWDVYRLIQQGMSPRVGERLSGIFENFDAVFLPVSKSVYPDYFGWSRWFYGGDDWPCLQLVWPDADGAFPWEPGSDGRFPTGQPNLTGATWPSI